MGAGESKSCWPRAGLAGGRSSLVKVDQVRLLTPAQAAARQPGPSSGLNSGTTTLLGEDVQEHLAASTESRKIQTAINKPNATDNQPGIWKVSQPVLTKSVIEAIPGRTANHIRR